ncbi:uncharacterized protein BDV17DRAFT_257105 [Aspergillus undulatus]|uniref:uncharacterized protein n=1 Tax=Aspergillus undulatus TaxID=1810928 RepID=UPI003CCD9D85
MLKTPLHRDGLTMLSISAIGTMAGQNMVIFLSEALLGLNWLGATHMALMILPSLN